VSHLLRGILLGLVIFLFAPFIVNLLGAPESRYIVQAMTVTFILQGARNPGALFFRRQLTFQKEFQWKATGAGTKFVVTVVFLYTIRNEWAIVCGVLAYELVMLILSYLLIDVRPYFKWHRDAFSSLFNYGKWVLLAAIFAFIERQGNQIATIKLLGEASLGVLFVGLRIGNVATLAAEQLKNTLFPTFSRLQDQPNETKRIYQHSMGATALFLFPLAGCAVVFADPFTRLFLGERWIEVAGILGLLLWAKTFMSLSVGIALLNAKGMPQFAFLNRLIQCIIIIILVYPLVKFFGLKGIAILYVMLGITSFVFSLVATLRYFSFEISILKVLFEPSLVSMLIVTLFYLV